MRRIVSKEHESKKRKKNQFVAGGVLIFLMFFSVLGYAFQLIANNGDSSGTINNGGSATINYNGFLFTEQSGFWILDKGGLTFIFKNNPEQVEKSSANVNPFENYFNKPLYINSENSEAKSEIRANLIQLTDGIENACLEGHECENSEKKVTCDDNFIEISASENEYGITRENNCIFIKGKNEDLVQLADEFLFKTLGVES